MYQLVLDSETGEEIGVITNSGHTFIPFAQGNKDYHVYLDWVAQGNQPDPPNPPQTL